METQKKPVILEGYEGKSHFIAVAPNVYVECDDDDNLRFNRGEVEIAKLFGEEFPNMEIRVTIGPWRSYDITGSIIGDRKVILIDIYSVRCPSVRSDYVTDLISNAHRLLAGKKLKPEQMYKV